MQPLRRCLLLFSPTHVGISWHLWSMTPCMTSSSLLSITMVSPNPLNCTHSTLVVTTQTKQRTRKMAQDKVINQKRNNSTCKNNLISEDYMIMKHSKVLITGLADPSDISPRQLLRESKDVASSSQSQSHQCFAFFVWMSVLRTSLNRQFWWRSTKKSLFWILSWCFCDILGEKQSFWAHMVKITLAGWKKVMITKYCLK